MPAILLRSLPAPAYGLLCWGIDDCAAVAGWCGWMGAFSRKGKVSQSESQLKAVATASKLLDAAPCDTPADEDIPCFLPWHVFEVVMSSADTRALYHRSMHYRYCVTRLRTPFVPVQLLGRCCAFSMGLSTKRGSTPQRRDGVTGEIA